ncbi:MAG: UDP-3-O-acyl-N-acetylglucosamine deacetylase, partial [Planctomycetes bacterium]|nr:UDP-3-O-acyl-N-acetylglucosamine deacetylase [Planctomycetota bacterium]
MRNQRTIASEVELEGHGLFTGKPVVVRLRPGGPHTGIWFVRTDQSPPARVAARIENVSKRARRTALRNGTAAIETVEHCLSACAGLGIDNLQIELNADELPSGDGSCLPFTKSLREAGITEQEAPREPCVIREVLRVVDGDSELIAVPPLDPKSETLEVSYELDYGRDNPIGHQAYRVTVTSENYEANLAPARTFVLAEEAEELRAAGLGLHLTYDDILVFGKDGVIDNQLRFPDECARHKILDLLGDLALLGQPIVGRIFARKSGHALNHTLVRSLREREDAARQASALTGPPEIDIRRLQRILPHRYPFLMIDR